MKKYLFIAASAALALSSCSSDEEMAQEVAGQNVPVAFDSYMGRTTRANTMLTGMDDDAYTKGIKDTGFGVYAYEQGTEMIEDYTKKSIVPNFFLNEKVTFNSNSWVYGTKDAQDNVTSGVKYWPNNPGSMLSFYAYAAYDATLSHQPTTNPCRLIYNGAYNGPAIYYKMPEDLTTAVDLCWGAEYGQSKAPVNKTKPSITENVKFNFKHAMARYGFNVQVWSDKMTDNYPDDTDHNANGDRNQAIEEGTTIKITSVKLSGNFATEGTLRLYDGTWDAQTALTGEYELKDNFSSTVKDGLNGEEAKAEIPLLDNENIYVMMIPGAKFQIVVEYQVITVDNKLEGGNSTVATRTASSEVFTAEAGKAVDFHLNLGMTTVKFDAVVTDWNKPADKQEVDLPANALEVVNAKEYYYFEKIANNFLGFTTVVPEGENGKYYFNNEVKDADGNVVTKAALMTWNADDEKWEQAAGDKHYFVNPQHIYFDSEKWEWIVEDTCDKWVKDNTGYFMLQPDGTYVVVEDYTGTPYASVEALAKEDPETGLYKVGETIYYYVQQETPAHP